MTPEIFQGLIETETKFNEMLACAKHHSMPVENLAIYTMAGLLDNTTLEIKDMPSLLLKAIQVSNKGRNNGTSPSSH